MFPLVRGYKYLPFASAAVPTNPLKPAHIPALFPPVETILRARSLPQVGSFIVQAVAVAMVNMKTKMSVEDDPMHQEHASLFLWPNAHHANRIPPILGFVVLSKPVPLIKPVVIGCIDNGKPPPAERYMSDRGIIWLFYLLPSNRQEIGSTIIQSVPVDMLNWGIAGDS